MANYDNYINLRLIFNAKAILVEQCPETKKGTK